MNVVNERISMNFTKDSESKKLVKESRMLIDKNKENVSFSIDTIDGMYSIRLVMLNGDYSVLEIWRILN